MFQIQTWVERGTADPVIKVEQTGYTGLESKVTQTIPTVKIDPNIPRPETYKGSSVPSYAGIFIGVFVLILCFIPLIYLVTYISVRMRTFDLPCSKAVPARLQPCINWLISKKRKCCSKFKQSKFYREVSRENGAHQEVYAGLQERADRGRQV